MFKSLTLSVGIIMFLVASVGAQENANQNKAKQSKSKQKSAQEVSTDEGSAKPKVGDQAPDWELVGSDGKKYKLSNYRGKQGVIVAWYPMALTGG